VRHASFVAQKGRKMGLQRGIIFWERFDASSHASSPLAGKESQITTSRMLKLPMRHSSEKKMKKQVEEEKGRKAKEERG